MENWLLSGGDQQLYGPLNVKKGANDLINDWKSKLAALEAKSKDKSVKIDRLREMKQIIDNNGLIVAYKNYLATQIRIQLHMLGSCLEELTACKDVSQVPGIISNLVQYIPDYLPTETIIAGKLLSTVKAVREFLVDDFHSHFEEHMGGQEDSTVTADPAVLWASFQATAATKLLGIFLVALLPCRVGDARLALERYADVLDHALTPLWGRFHFHLSHARQECSARQLAWTFRYARSFTEMCVALCGRVSGSSVLQQVWPEDYDAAARTHVFLKAGKFVRAHVAQVLATLFGASGVTEGRAAGATAAVGDHQAQWSLGGAFSILVESCMDFDSLLQHLAPNPALLEYTSDTLFDARCARDAWMRMERAYFCDALAAVCKDEDSATAETGVSRSKSHRATPFTSCFEKSPTSSCYHIVVECLALLALANQRYAALSDRTRKAMVVVVMEPMMVGVLVAVLYRVRTHTSLKQLAAAAAPAPGEVIGIRRQRRRPSALDRDALAELEAMYASLDTAVVALDGIKSTVPSSSTPTISKGKGGETEVWAASLWQEMRQRVAEALRRSSGLRALLHLVLSEELSVLDGRNILSEVQTADSARIPFAMHMTAALEFVTGQLVAIKATLREQAHTKQEDGAGGDLHGRQTC